MIKQKNHQNNKNVSFLASLPAYFYIHAQVFFSSIGRLARSPFSSAMTILVMAIAISLASGFYLLVTNMQKLTVSVESSNQISLFLKLPVSHKAATKLVENIKRDTRIKEVILITKEQALAEFKSYSGFGEVLNMLDSNPLPIVIQCLPKNTLDDQGNIKSLVAELSKLPQVDFVQIDMQWVKRLQSIMQIMQRGVLLLTILLGFAVLLMTGNSVRLELQNRKDEVLVAKLIGATPSFIQRPFLYTGFCLGLLSGFLAWIIVTLMTLILQAPVERLSILYDGSFEISYLAFLEIIYLLSITSSLGIIGAWIVLHYQLKQIKPV